MRKFIIAGAAGFLITGSSGAALAASAADCQALFDKADINRDGAAVGRLGYAFVAALDFDRFTYVWCRNTPPPSEAGKALAFVRLDRACQAAKGRAVGTGYADVPGS